MYVVAAAACDWVLCCGPELDDCCGLCDVDLVLLIVFLAAPALSFPKPSFLWLMCSVS